MSEARYTTVRMRLRGSVAAVEQLLADLEAAELPWCQVLGAGEALLRRGEAQQHLIVQVQVRGSSDVS